MTRLLKRKFDDATGKVCEALIPIKHERFEGQGKDVAICTLGSIDLLEEISKSPLMARVAIAGRLLSENKGIDAIIHFASCHPDLKQIILCGKEVRGHMAGQALLSLHKNGIDEDGRIVGAKGPYPSVKSRKGIVDRFREQVDVMDMVDVIDLAEIAQSIT